MMSKVLNQPQEEAGRGEVETTLRCDLAAGSSGNARSSAAAASRTADFEGWTELTEVSHSLQSARVDAHMAMSDSGRVVVLGPVNSGKSSYIMELANMALNHGIDIIYADLNTDLNSLAPPGFMALAPITERVTAEKGFLCETMDIYPYGLINVLDKPHLHGHMVRQLVTKLDALQTPAGSIINVPSGVEEVWMKSLELLKPDRVLVIRDRKLCKQVQKFLRGKVGNMGDRVFATWLPRVMGPSKYDAPWRIVEDSIAYFTGDMTALAGRWHSVPFDKLRVFELVEQATPTGVNITAQPRQLTVDDGIRLLAVSTASTPEEITQSCVAGFVQVVSVQDMSPPYWVDLWAPVDGADELVDKYYIWTDVQQCM